MLIPFQVGFQNAAKDAYTYIWSVPGGETKGPSGCKTKFNARYIPDDTCTKYVLCYYSKPMNCVLGVSNVFRVSLCVCVSKCNSCDSSFLGRNGSYHWPLKVSYLRGTISNCLTFASLVLWYRTFKKLDCSLIWNFCRMCQTIHSSNCANFMEK